MIESKTNKCFTVSKSYPYIGRYQNDKCDYLVLFISKKTGVCIQSDNNNQSVGMYCNSWAEELFTYFDKEVFLKNV